MDGQHRGGAALAWALSKHPQVQVQTTRAGIAEHVWLRHAVDRWRSELGLQVQVLKPGEDLAAGQARLVIGCVGDAEVDSLLEHLGVVQHETHWSIGGMGSRKPGAWLVATFKDPAGDGLPVTLLCAQEAKWLEPGLKRLQPGTLPMLRLYQGGFPVLETELNSLGQVRHEKWADCRPWHMQPKGVVETKRHFYKHWRVDSVGRIATSDLNGYADAVDQTWQALGLWSGLVVPEAPKLFAQDSAFQWRFSDNPGDWAQVDAQAAAVQALVLPGFAGDGGAQAGQALLEDHLGPAPWPWLAEAAAVQASGVYWGVPLERWWATLARMGDLPTPQILISGEGLARVSPHLVTPLRALLVQVVVEQDRRQLLRLWNEGEVGEDWKPWFAAFGERLGELAAVLPRRQQPVGLDGWPTRLGASLKGGFDLDGPGLASEAHQHRLQILQQAQSGAVAHTLSLASQPHSALVRTRPLRRSQALADVRSETLLMVSIYRARSLGMATALQLEIWATPSGILIQDLIWPSLAGVDEFFDSYARGARHAALFSNLAGVELLCLGEGMGEIVRTQARESEREDDARLDILELRSRSWQRLIKPLRDIYGGALILSVPNTNSVESTDVWSSLDAVGINLILAQRSLVQAGGGAPSSLERRWARELEKASQASAGKPYVLWSVGQSSIVSPGQGHDLAGVNGALVQNTRALAALGRVLSAMGGDGPRACFLSPLGLDSLVVGQETRISGAIGALEAFAAEK